MHNMPPTPFLAMSPYGQMPPGYGLVGLPRPDGIQPPPPAGIEMREMAMVRHLNSHRDPRSVAWTEFMSDKGGDELWMQFAKQYRREAGFLRGWIGTGLIAVAMGVASLKTNGAKNHYRRLRPYQIDGSITSIGKAEKSGSYPSGHTSKAYSAATVLSRLWPARAYEFNWWARQVGLSRIHGGQHFPSDVKVGALLGQKIGFQVSSLLN